MPSKSPAQARLMAGAAHDPAFADKVGVPQSVAREFNAADKGTGIIQPKGGNMGKPFTPFAPAAAMPPAAAPPKAGKKGAKKPPNHGKATKGSFKSDSPKDRSDKGIY
jgi:hypothetical protein